MFIPVLVAASLCAATAHVASIPVGPKLEGRREVVLGADGEALARAAASEEAAPHVAVVSADGAATSLLASLSRAGDGTASAPAQPVRQAVNGSTPTGTIMMGSPPVEFEVIFDTGSDKLVAKTWSTVKRELQAVDGAAADSVQPTGNVYDHSNSKSYKREYIQKGTEKVEKRGYIAYGSGVAVTEEGTDNIKAGGRELKAFPISEIVTDSLAVLHRKGGAAGVFGLQHMKNRSAGQSFFSACRDQGLMTAVGYCRGKNNTGTVIWGDDSAEGQAIPVLGTIHWAVKLNNVEIVNAHQHRPSGSSSSSSGRSGGGDAAHGPPAPGSSRGASKRLVVHKASGPSPPPSNEGGGAATGAPQRHAAPAAAKPGVHSRAINVMDQGDTRALISQAQQDFFSGFVRAKYAGEGEVLGEGMGVPRSTGSLVSDGDDEPEPAAGAGASGWQESAARDNEQANESHPQPLKFCHDGPCTAIIDTGSNIIAGPSKVLTTVTKTLNVKLDCSNLDELPPLKIQLGSFKATIPPASYVMKVALPGWASPMQRPQPGQRTNPLTQPSRHNQSEHTLDADAPSLVGSLEDASAGSFAAAGAWGQVFQHLHDNRGLDFGPALHGKDLRQLMSMRQLCMPALVPIDKDTRLGALWVVGTPLFDNYYARWSWPKAAHAPEIFIKEVRETKACRGEASTEPPSESAAGSPDHDSDKGGDVLQTGRGSLMRSEARRPRAHPSMRRAAAEADAFERDLDDIRFPHWANSLVDL